MSRARLSRALIGSLSLILAACGGGGDGPSAPAATFADISGGYNGRLVGISQGVALDATFSVTLTQNGGTIGGSYGISGAITDGFNVEVVSGSGTVAGTVATGTNPSVNLRLRFGGCPNNPMDYTGAYDQANRRLTLTGPVDIFDNQCRVALRYNSVIILTR